MLRPLNGVYGGKRKVDFETSKNLGGIGAILMFIGILPYISLYGLTLLVGALLVLIAMKGMADYYKDAGIFNNVLYGTIAGIVGIVVFVAVILTAAIGFIADILPNWNGDWTSLTQLNPADVSTNIAFSNIGTFAAAVLISFVVLFIFVLVVALLYRKSLEILRSKTGVGLFGTTGTILLIGAVLTIIAIGLILVWIAMLLLAIAFFQLRPQPTQTATSPESQTQM